ncbi:serine hydrolase domain-containing protein [Bacteroidota bacterium]
MLIEEVSGLGFIDYINENIIKKANINPDDLSFTISNKGHQAIGYQKRFSFTNLILGMLMDKSKYMNKSEGKWISSKNFYVSGTPYGGLIGSGKGFVAYLQEMLRKESCFISEESKTKLFTENRTNNNKATGMCLGWFKGELEGHTYFTHAGGGGFYYCEIRIYPELGTGSVIMFNRTGMTDSRILDKADEYFLNPRKE